MSDNEQNSAEREAEEILMEAYPLVRAEECPQGDQCSVHFRVDSEYFDEAMKYARLINYTGEYCVITEDNHELDSPVALLLAVLGGKEFPPLYETTIFHVGSGVIGDLMGCSNEEFRAAVRYVAKHDEWDGIKDFHEVTISALEQGMIDVSKGLEN